LAGSTKSTSDPGVLLIWNADYELVLRDPTQLAARPLKFRDMLQNLRAEHTVERAIRKIKLGHITRDSQNPGTFEGRYSQIQRGHVREEPRQDSREVAVPRPHVQNR
jgi:hypothetical protein